MLKFSAQQFENFGARYEANFFVNLRAELHDFMTRKIPDLEDDRKESRITRAFTLCRDHGFRTEKEITELSYILVTFPSDFARRPEYAWLDGMLCATGSARQRLERIKSVINGAAA